ncbi:penicillin-binding protein [Pseudomonas aeruginosa]|nr:penicillin-binding protein [Pseudomonas aeruginosa]
MTWFSDCSNCASLTFSPPEELPPTGSAAPRGRASRTGRAEAQQQGRQDAGAKGEAGDDRHEKGSPQGEKPKQPHHTSRTPAVSNGAAGRRRKHRHSGATRVRPPVPAETNAAARRAQRPPTCPSAHLRIPACRTMHGLPARRCGATLGRFTRRPSMRLITSCLLLAAALPAMAQIYQYTDANGNKVFTNQPPDGVQAQTVGTAADQYRRIDTPERPRQCPGREAPPPTRSLPQRPPTEEALRANNGTFNVSVSIRPALHSGTSCNWCWTASPTARRAAAPASPCTRSTAATTASRYRYSTANGCCNPARR